MATIFIDGFDKYGPTNIDFPSLSSTLPQGKWTFATIYTTPQIIGSLSGESGNAVEIGSTLAHSQALSRTLPTNYSRLIGGFRFSTNLLTDAGCAFLDNSTSQCSIVINATSGFVAITEGADGTVLQRSSASVASDTIHYLEFDVTFNSGVLGGWTVWLDGVQVLAGTGTTQQSGNNYANVFQLITFSQSGNGNLAADDLYLFDATTSFNNSALLSNPIIVTQVPIGDHQTQFTNNGNVFGNTNSAYLNTPENGGYNLAANSLYLAPFTPNASGTLNDVIAYPIFAVGGTNPTANFKGVIYSDNAGVPDTLLSSSSQVTGCVEGQPIILPLSPPQSVVAGTQYWLGFINDSLSYLQFADQAPQTFHGYKAANTYSSGPPATAPSMTPNQASIFLYGACSGATTNWESEALNPPIGDSSAVVSATATTEDLYTFPALPTNVQEVYTVVVSGNCRLTFPGTHTFDLRASSSGTDSGGSNTGITPSLSYAWYDSNFDTDPHTSAAWAVAAVTATYCGMEVVS